MKGHGMKGHDDDITTEHRIRMDIRIASLHTDSWTVAPISLNASSGMQGSSPEGVEAVLVQNLLLLQQ